MCHGKMVYVCVKVNGIYACQSNVLTMCVRVKGSICVAG